MAAYTSQQHDRSAAAMGLDVSYLWHLMSHDLILGFGEPPAFEGRLIYDWIGFTTIDLPAIWLAGSLTQFS